MADWALYRGVFHCSFPVTAPQDAVVLGFHASEVVRSHGEREHRLDFLQPSHHDLTHVSNNLDPTIALLDGFSLLLRDALALGVGDFMGSS